MVDQNAIVRLRYHRAPFLFGPQYLATNEEWQRSFVDLVTAIQSDIGVEPDRVFSGDQFRLGLMFGPLQFSLDADAGEFDLREPSDFEDDDLNDRSWSGVGEVPDNFFVELERLRIPPAFLSIVQTRIKPFIQELLRRMQWRFRRALSQGIAEVQARPNSPLNDFTRIDRDSFGYFVVDVEDRLPHFRELDCAEGPNRERLFSVCVVPAIAAGTGTKPMNDNARSSFGRKRRNKRGPSPTYDWKGTVDPIILEIRRRDPTKKKSHVQKEVTEKLANAGLDEPGKIQLSERIRTFFSGIKKSLWDNNFRNSGNCFSGNKCRNTGLQIKILRISNKSTTTVVGFEHTAASDGNYKRRLYEKSFSRRCARTAPRYDRRGCKAPRPRTQLCL